MFFAESQKLYCFHCDWPFETRNELKNIFSGSWAKTKEENFLRTRVSHGLFFKISTYLIIKILFISMLTLSEFKWFHRVSCVMGFVFRSQPTCRWWKLNCSPARIPLNCSFFDKCTPIFQSLDFSLMIKCKVGGFFFLFLSIPLDATIHRGFS